MPIFGGVRAAASRYMATPIIYKVGSVLSHMQWLAATTYTPIKQRQISYHRHVKSPISIAALEKTS